jgi:hypothetical protein
MNRQLNFRNGIALALAMALGCGGNTTSTEEDTVASEQEELAAESELAVDALEAMSDVADEDATFADVSLPAAGGKDVLLDDRGDSGRPGPRPKKVRVHMGRILRLLTRGGAVLCGAAATVERTTADSGCALIGRNGQYVNHVSVTFANCELPLGLTIDGAVTVDTTKALVAGATCDQAGIAVDSTHSVTFANLKATVRGLGSAQVNGTGSSHGVRGPGAAAPTREWRLDHTRKLTEADGTVRLDQHVFGSGSTRLDRSGSEPALVRNGTFTAELNLRALTVTTTHTDVRRVRSCCHPISGSISVVATKGAEMKSRMVEFGPACGAATVNGEAKDLRTCM